MSHSLATASEANSFRRFVARVWSDPDSRSVTIGVVAAILFHLMLWLIAPYLLRFEPAVGGTQATAAAKQFNIELAPETFTKQEPKPQPNKFVETNPDAPENTPDKTTNFAARNQQVAQEKPTPDGKSDRPALEGKKDFDSTQIVSGQLTTPEERLAALPQDVTPPNEAVAAPKAEQNPLPGFEKKEGEDKSGFGSNIARIPDNARPVPQKVDGAKDVPVMENATATRPTVDRERPQPRPQLVKQAQTRPGVFAENKFGTTNIGNIAVDARWSNYGQYLQRLIDTVQVQWERILIETRLNPPPSTVTVKFILDSEGKIARIVNVNGTAPEAAERACVSAIGDRSPYGPWTDDMKALLG
ncbi:MAG: hypothetical protein ABIZ49_14430, partial [Opitutaceae bacterium]